MAITPFRLLNRPNTLDPPSIPVNRRWLAELGSMVFHGSTIVAAAVGPFWGLLGQTGGHSLDEAILSFSVPIHFGRVW
jgi:hypothetical protein